jgi:hypothetical protein
LLGCPFRQSKGALVDDVSTYVYREADIQYNVDSTWVLRGSAEVSCAADTTLVRGPTMLKCNHAAYTILIIVDPTVLKSTRAANTQLTIAELYMPKYLHAAYTTLVNLS